MKPNKEHKERNKGGRPKKGATEKLKAGGFHDEKWDCKVAVARIHELLSKIGI